MTRFVRSVLFAGIVLGFLVSLRHALFRAFHLPPMWAEGQILYEAERFYRGFPVYTDFLRGAFEHGDPPAHTMVVYPPLWSKVLSLGHLDAVPARLLGAGIFTLSCGVVLWRAERKMVALAAAMGATGAYVFMLEVFSVRPDAVAVALVVMALVLVRRERVALSGFLLALAALMKPNVVGAFLGVVLYVVFCDRKKALPLACGALLSALPLLGWLFWISDGTFLSVLRDSTLQPWRWERFLDGLVWAIPFVWPLLALAWFVGRAAHERTLLFALGASTLLAQISVGKVGSAYAYFLEPAMVAFVLLAEAASKVTFTKGALGLALFQMVWVSVANINNAREAFETIPKQVLVFDRARASCRGLVASTSPGAEWALNRRLLVASYHGNQFVRAGRITPDFWVAVLASPNVSCVLAVADDFSRPDDAASEFPPEVRKYVRDHFEKTAEGGDVRLYEKMR